MMKKFKTILGKLDSVIFGASFICCPFVLAELEQIPSLNPLEDNLETIRDKLEKGADPNSDQKGFDAPIFDYIIHENEEAIELLLKYGADINILDSAPRTPINYAISRGASLNIVKALLKADDIDLNIPTHRTVLYRLTESPHHGHISAQPEDVTKMKLLIEAGADVNGASSERGFQTPLHGMVYNLRSDAAVEMTKLLLENGANVNQKDGEGVTPFMFLIDHLREDYDSILLKKIVRAEEQEVAELMLRHGAVAPFKKAKVFFKGYQKKSLKAFLADGKEFNSEELLPLNSCLLGESAEFSILDKKRKIYFTYKFGRASDEVVQQNCQLAFTQVQQALQNYSSVRFVENPKPIGPRLKNAETNFIVEGSTWEYVPAFSTGVFNRGH